MLELLEATELVPLYVIWDEAAELAIDTVGEPDAVVELPMAGAPEPEAETVLAIEVAELILTDDELVALMDAAFAFWNTRREFTLQ